MPASGAPGWAYVIAWQHRRQRVDVAGDLLGLHSSDAASVVLAARARTANVTAKDVERALCDDRVLARVLGMRRTMFVVPVGLVPVIHAACTRALALHERAQLVRLLEEAGDR
jgi:winged helix DNA-binding protein